MALISWKMVSFTGKNGYTRTRELRTRTRPVRHLPVPDPYPRVRVGSGIPAGTGRPAHLYCIPRVLLNLRLCLPVPVCPFCR